MGAIHRLSQKQISTAGDGMHADGGNLYLRRKGNAASWVFRYFSKVHHKTFDLGIGKYPEVDLSKARRKALEYRTKIVDGVDLAAEHMRLRREAATVAAAPTVTPIGYTFERAAREFIAAQDPGWGRSSSKQWTESLQNYAFPAIGRIAIDRVDTKDVLRVIEPTWKEKHETARRIRARVERILDWAKAKGHRRGDNPARWEGHLEHLLANGLKRVEHHPAVPVKDIPKFVAKVRACKRTSARALEMLTLTACRTDEVRCATFGEFDLEAKVWVIPAPRTKTGKKSGQPHVVPLSDRAVAIVEAQRAAAKDPSGYMFVGERTGGLMGYKQMNKIMHALCGGEFKDRYTGEDAVPHGLRSSFRDWCAQNGHPRDLAELSLSHLVGGATERSYWRDKQVEQRRAIMDAWARYCDGRA
jgi:integrase